MQTFPDNQTSVEVNVDGQQRMLHVLDREDVAITPAGLKLIIAAAREVFAGSAPAEPQQAVSLFVDRIYWEEDSGTLIMCNEMRGRNICLPIPKKHWRIRPYTGLVQ